MYNKGITTNSAQLSIGVFNNLQHNFSGLTPGLNKTQIYAPKIAKIQIRRVIINCKAGPKAESFL